MIICPIQSSGKIVEAECSGEYCPLWHKQKKKCGIVLAVDALVNIAKYLDRLHSSTIKH